MDAGLDSVSLINYGYWLLDCAIVSIRQWSGHCQIGDKIHFWMINIKYIWFEIDLIFFSFLQVQFSGMVQYNIYCKQHKYIYIYIYIHYMSNSPSVFQGILENIDCIITRYNCDNTNHIHCWENIDNIGYMSTFVSDNRCQFMDAELDSVSLTNHCYWLLVCTMASVRKQPAVAKITYGTWLITSWDQFSFSIIYIKYISLEIKYKLFSAVSMLSTTVQYNTILQTTQWQRQKNFKLTKDTT